MSFNVLKKRASQVRRSRTENSSAKVAREEDSIMKDKPITTADAHQVDISEGNICSTGDVVATKGGTTNASHTVNEVKETQSSENSFTSTESVKIRLVGEQLGFKWMGVVDASKRGETSRSVYGGDTVGNIKKVGS